jgi:hypothetical protein
MREAFFRPLLGAACLSAVLAVPFHAHAETATMTACTPLVDATTLTRETFLVLERCPDTVPVAPPPLPGFQAMEPAPPAVPASRCTVTLIPIDPTQPLPVWVEQIAVAPEELAMERLP